MSIGSIHYHDANTRQAAEEALNEALRQRKKKEGCFIATACYENSDAPELVALRAWRDDCLYNHICGRVFIRCYYRISPHIAVWLTKHNSARSFARRIVDKVVRIIK